MPIFRPNLSSILADIRLEVVNAQQHYPPMHSAHEGWAIIHEEMDELWAEVKVKQSKRNLEAIYTEAKQVAAMAVRFMLDIDGRT